MPQVPFTIAFTEFLWQLVLLPLLLFYLASNLLSTDIAGVQFAGHKLEVSHRRHACKINSEIILFTNNV